MKSILIVKTSALGDVVHTLPVLHYLRSRFPKARIDWVVEKGSVDFLSAQPFLDRAIAINTKAWRKGKQWKEIRAFFRTLRETKYDAVFDLQGNFKSALITLCAKAKDKVGFGFYSVPEKPNLLATNQRFEVPTGINVRARYLHVVQSYFNDPVPFIEHPVSAAREKQPKIMVCFGSKWPNKQLSAQTWKAFLHRVAEETGYPFVFIWGDEKEKTAADELQRAFSGSSETLGGMALLEWQQRMGEMTAVIAVDSMGLHLCGLTDTPTFGVFGPSSSAVYQPLGASHGAFQAACPYGIKFTERCPRLRSCATGACLKELGSEKLAAAFITWWRAGRSSGVFPQHQSLLSPSPRLPCTVSP
ncbi:MAG TPA: glycosyltransferase family 9 protein [Rhabdochlamydiaceae bacterium]